MSRPTKRRGLLGRRARLSSDV